MPHTIRPIRNFASTVNEKEEVLFARRLIIATLNVFTDARGNHYLDILERPARLAKFIFTDRPVRKTQTSADDVVHLSNLNAQDKAYTHTLFTSVINSYYLKIGNCDFMAKVALYLASKHGKDILQSASVVSLWAVDHVLLKLVFKNGTELFVDPWFKNHEFEGAVFTAASAKQYYKEVTDILSKSLMIQVPVVGLITFFTIFMPEDQSNAAFVTTFLIASSLMTAIHLYYLAHKSFLTPSFVERVKVHNEDTAAMRLRILMNLSFYATLVQAQSENRITATFLLDQIKKYRDFYAKFIENSSVGPQVTFGLIESVCDKNLIFTSRHKRTQSLPNLLERPPEHEAHHSTSHSFKRRMSF